MAPTACRLRAGGRGHAQGNRVLFPVLLPLFLFLVISLIGIYFVLSIFYRMLARAGVWRDDLLRSQSLRCRQPGPVGPPRSARNRQSRIRRPGWYCRAEIAAVAVAAPARGRDIRAVAARSGRRSGGAEEQGRPTRASGWWRRWKCWGKQIRLWAARASKVALGAEKVQTMQGRPHLGP